MVRNCLIAIALWIALVAGYAWHLRDEPKLAERSDYYAAVLAIASVVWIGLAMATGARYTLRDWRARNRMARGERPQDGDLVAATGPIGAGLESLQAPFSGRPCVIYQYEIGPPPNRPGATQAKDYVGYAFVRCTVQTPYGAFAIGSDPLLEGVPKVEGDPDAAKALVERTTFEDVDILELAKAIFRVHTEPPPLRRDFRIGTPSASGRMDAAEQVIAAGDVVTVFGRYVAASNSIVSDIKEKGYLRLRPGGSGYRESAFPGKAILQFLGGLAIAAAANGVLWLLTR